VYSRTLRAPSSARTRIEHDIVPARASRLKGTAERDLSVGGAELAGHALAAGLVAECNPFVERVVVGGGKRALPRGFGTQLDLAGERRFRSGVVHLRYMVLPPRRD
jgi:dihydrofolate reductase